MKFPSVHGAFQIPLISNLRGKIPLFGNPVEAIYIFIHIYAQSHIYIIHTQCLERERARELKDGEDQPYSQSRSRSTEVDLGRPRSEEVEIKIPLFRPYSGSGGGRPRSEVILDKDPVNVDLRRSRNKSAEVDLGRR